MHRRPDFTFCWGSSALFRSAGAVAVVVRVRRCLGNVCGFYFACGGPNSSGGGGGGGSGGTVATRERPARDRDAAAPAGARAAAAAHPQEEQLHGEDYIPPRASQRSLEGLSTRLGEQLNYLGELVQVGSAESGGAPCVKEGGVSGVEREPEGQYAAREDAR